MEGIKELKKRWRRAYVSELSSPGMTEPDQMPFPTVEMGKIRYKVFGIVTNMELEGNQLITWLHQRCGKSEEAHSIMKEDLAGGKLLSGASRECSLVVDHGCLVQVAFWLQIKYYPQNFAKEYVHAQVHETACHLMVYQDCPGVDYNRVYLLGGWRI